MKEAKISGSACVLVLLFSSLVSCSGVFGSPLTDDVATLDTLRENLPEDYKIPVRFISKGVGGTCWLHLNLFPLEISLKALALKFGNLSTNRENITIFITMLQGLRFTVDNEELEATMQVFKCHYQSESWSTRRYFDHVKEVLGAFASAPRQFHCIPPPCPTVPPITPGQDSQKEVIDGVVPSLLALLVISCIATLALALRTVILRKACCAKRRYETDVSRFPGPERSETQSDPEDGSIALHNDPESSPLHKQCRAQQDSLGSEDTGV